MGFLDTEALREQREQQLENPLNAVMLCGRWDAAGPCSVSGTCCTRAAQCSQLLPAVSLPCQGAAFTVPGQITAGSCGHIISSLADMKGCARTQSWREWCLFGKVQAPWASSSGLMLCE